MSNLPNSTSPLTQGISFHLTSNDLELVEKVSSIMKRNGHLSFCDSMGKEHYLVDGRKGVSVLSKNIDKLAKKLSDEQIWRVTTENRFNSIAVEQTMSYSGIPRQLKGFRYLKYILCRLLEDEALISPISKTIYPEITERFQCTSLQIDRDIRYAVSKSKIETEEKSPKAFVCLLLDIAKGLIEDMEHELNMSSINNDKIS